MSTLTRLALGAMGRLRPRPASGNGPAAIVLPPPERHGGLPLFDTLSLRRSGRSFRPDPLPLSVLSTLLWAAWGRNRDDGGRTAPSAIGAQEIDLYVALRDGTYVYEPTGHALRRVTDTDLRRVTGYQDFVDEAPLDLVFVADHRRMALVPAGARDAYANVAAGAIAQNVYLACASLGLSTVLRAWLDRDALAEALGLGHDEVVLLAQTVGYPAEE